MITFHYKTEANRSRTYWDDLNDLVATFQDTTFGRTAEHLFREQCIVRSGHKLLNEYGRCEIGTLDEITSPDPLFRT